MLVICKKLLILLLPHVDKLARKCHENVINQIAKLHHMSFYQLDLGNKCKAEIS
jgi:hypothetical protein